jgi:hypothetical protein
LVYIGDFQRRREGVDSDEWWSILCILYHTLYSVELSIAQEARYDRRQGCGTGDRGQGTKDTSVLFCCAICFVVSTVQERVGRCYTSDSSERVALIEVEKEEEGEEQEEEEILSPWTVGVGHIKNLRLLHIMLFVARYVSTHYSPLLLMVLLLLLPLLLQLLLLLLLPFLGVDRGILGTERDRTLPPSHPSTC